MLKFWRKKKRVEYPLATLARDPQVQSWMQRRARERSA
jgi:hypothetical protein